MPMPSTIARGNVVMECVLSVSLNPNNGSSIAAGNSVETAYTINGIIAGDFLEINKPTHTAGIAAGNIRTSGANTIAVQWLNVSTAAITPSSEAYLITVTRYENIPTTPPSVIT